MIIRGRPWDRAAGPHSRGPRAEPYESRVRLRSGARLRRADWAAENMRRVLVTRTMSTGLAATKLASRVSSAESRKPVRGLAPVEPVPITKREQRQLAIA